MSRNYATFATSIWRPEDDFGELTMAAQWAYFMLSTQPDISAAGVLSLNVRRWSKRTKDGSREVVIGALQELQAAGKVFYDYDTEELLIRTFVKWDGGYGNQKRRPVIERAAMDLESARLRQVLAEELRRLGDPTMALLADRLSTPYGIAYAAEAPAIAPGDPQQHPPRNGGEGPTGAFSQVDSLSDSHADGVSRSDGVVVTQGLVVDPQTTTHNPGTQPLAGATSPKERPPRSRGLRLPENFAPSESSLKWASEKAFPFDIAAETEKFCLHWWSETGSSSTKLDWDRAWQKWMLNARDRYGQRVNRDIQPRQNWDPTTPRPSTATQRMQQALDVAEQLDRQMAAGGTP